MKKLTNKNNCKLEKKQISFFYRFIAVFVTGNRKKITLLSESKQMTLTKEEVTRIQTVKATMRSIKGDAIQSSVFFCFFIIFVL